jgi:hypothetical protein
MLSTHALDAGGRLRERRRDRFGLAIVYADEGKERQRLAASAARRTGRGRVVYIQPAQLRESVFALLYQ